MLIGVNKVLINDINYKNQQMLKLQNTKTSVGLFLFLAFPVSNYSM